MKQTLGFLSIIFLLLLYSLLSMNLVKEVNTSRSLTNEWNLLIQPEDIQLPTNSYFYDATGQLFEEVIGEQNRRYLPYKDIPKPFINAFIATEDQYFFDHKGFDLSGMIRSFVVNLKQNEIEQGGSTITQQLIRNLYLSNEKTVSRKLKEVLLAYQLEKKLSKEQIVELYVNAIYFQHGIYGIEAASQFYFQRPASSLTLGEIAFLSAIPNNPTYYDPLQHFDHTKQRQQWVLKRLWDTRQIEQKQFQAAIQQPIQLRVRQPVHLFPDYATYVYHEFTELVAEQEGFRKQLVQASEQEKKAIQEKLENRVYELLYQKGIKIHTALNPTIQKKAHQALLRHVPQKDIEGAITIINHQQQRLLALVGGKEMQRRGFNRAFQSYRQPGSTIKPLLVYGPYLDQYDVSIGAKVNAGPFCKGRYCPQNYGGRTYGTVPLSTALKYSLNTAAVRLLDQMGVDTGFSYLQRFSFSKVSDHDQRLTAALGGLTYGVTPFELTNAYTVFGNQGNYVPAHAITKVTDHNGQLLYQWKPQTSRVWSEKTNNQMRTALHKVVKEGTATAANFNTSYIGGKTGTTDDAKDLWFVGLTANYTAGVWLGYDQPKSLSLIEKKRPHLLIWKDIMAPLAK